MTAEPMISINSALDAVLAAVTPMAAEEIELLATFDRVLAETVISPEDVPSFDNLPWTATRCAARTWTPGAETCG